MDRHLVLALALSLGCAEEPNGRSDEVPIQFVSGQTRHDDAVLADAEEILGMVLVEVPPGRGSVVLLREDELQNGRSGSASAVHPCTRVVWAIDDAKTVAHEIGHALALEHVDDRDNLMYPYDLGGTDLTDEQVDRMRWVAWGIQHYCD